MAGERFNQFPTSRRSQLFLTVLLIGIVTGVFVGTDRLQEVGDGEPSTAEADVWAYNVTTPGERVSSIVRYYYITNSTYRTMNPRVDGMFYGGWRKVDGFHVRINSEGLRGAEFPREKTEDLRVLVVGDAYTFGRGVNETETFPAQLEEMLSTAGRDVRVINAGVPGFGLWDYRQFLKIQGMRYQPDMVVVAASQIDRMGIDDRLSINREIASTIARIRQNLSLPKREKLDQIEEERRRYWREYVERRTLSTDEDLRAIDRITGPVCTILYVHDRSNIWPEPPSDRFFITFRDFDWDRNLTLPDTYPGPAGHEMHAKTLYRDIESLPARCSTS